jgi:hypothetical protein
MTRFFTHVPPDFSNQTTEAQNSLADAQKARDNLIEDAQDELMESPQGKKIFAVHRNQSRSNLLVEFLNCFGNLGGFDSMLRILDHEKDSANLISLLDLFVTCFSDALPNFHRSFYREFSLKLEDAAVRILSAPTSSQLRGIKKEGIDGVIDGLYDKVLKRQTDRDSLSLKDAKLSLSCTVGKVCLEQHFLERRIDGLKILGETCQACLDLKMAQLQNVGGSDSEV